MNTELMITVVNQKALIDKQAKHIYDLLAAMRDIARQPEGDEESAQSIAKHMLSQWGINF